MYDCGCTTGYVCEKHEDLQRRYVLDTAGYFIALDRYGNKIDLKSDHIAYEYTFNRAHIQDIKHKSVNRVLLAIVVWCSMAAIEQKLYEQNHNM